jgi:competence protein ComEC
LFCKLQIFDKSPALYYAFYSAIGTGFAFSGQLLLPIIGILLWLPYLYQKEFSRPFLSAILSFAFYFYAISTIWHSPIPEKGAEGIAWIHIEKITLKRGGREAGWSYKGTLRHFFGAVEAHQLPFTLKLRAKSPRPLADRDYLVHATLYPTRGKGVKLIPSDAPWEDAGFYSVGEVRYKLKAMMENLIDTRYSSPPAVHFLKGLLLGDFDERSLRDDFAQLGLLHLLAISGFHFSLLAEILRRLFSPFLPFRITCLLMLFLLCGYFFLLGFGPSVVRAWLTCMVVFGGFAVYLRSFSLNVLGAAVLASLLIDPLMIVNVGFQLSAGVTASILLFFPFFKKQLGKIFPKRSLDELDAGPLADHAGYLILSGFRSSIALTLSTLPFALPLTLYYFHQFPLLSLFYNLFFPFFVSISLFLLLLSFLPWVGIVIGKGNDYLTSFFLNMTYEIPESWAWKWEVDEISAGAVLVYLVIVFVLGISLRRPRESV